MSAAAVIFLIVAAAAIALGSFWYFRRTRIEPVACAPGPIKIDPTKRTFVPESCFVEIDGARLHYVRAGVGPDLVLVHGLGASLFIWRFLFPLLESRFRVTAIDLAGFGKSSKDPKRDYGLDAQAELLAKALTAIDIDKAYLAGSSMGGTLALWLGKLYPERFTQVAALAPATDQSLVPASAEHFAVASVFFRRALNRRTMRILLNRVVSKRELISDDVVDAYLEPFLDHGESVRAFWSALRLIRDPRLPDGLKGLSCRVLLVYGERDLLVSRKVINRLHGILPAAELLAHEEGGHHIMEDFPEWTAQTLCDFFTASRGN